MFVTERLLKEILYILAFASAIGLGVAEGDSNSERFSYLPILQETTGTLSVVAQSTNAQTGKVTFNGVDVTPVSRAFTWDFGDGTVVQGWFPQNHVYADKSQNYIVTVKSHYTDGGTDLDQALVRFTEPQVEKLFVPHYLAVTMPNSDTELASRTPYSVPARLTHMPSDCFDLVSRDVVEYVMSVATAIQMDFAGNDVVFPEETFKQIVLQDPGLQGGGLYSLWFTTPVSFAASCDAMKGSIAYSSFFHEIGHNVTLNFPADYHFGGKIDGNANAIYSETMAQIFQHATAFEMLNHADTYGLSQDLVCDIARSAEASFMVIKDAHDTYVKRDADNRYSSWNTPNTTNDETFGTFMTLAYKFIEHVELANHGFRGPTQRLCRFLGFFNPQWRTQFSQHQNNASAESFRASLMVAALSYAVKADLRGEFKALSFPINDTTFDDLTEYVQSRVPLPLVTLTDLNTLFAYWLEERCSSLNNGCDGADHDGSGVVDFVDYAILIGQRSEVMQ
ncbi:MAG: PKD domain-containing protein [Phycisphaeraceae bacterium]|nr:PKD domain-containing protein [Phycisphaeraceae bacterium]